MRILAIATLLLTQAAFAESVTYDPVLANLRERLDNARPARAADLYSKDTPEGDNGHNGHWKCIEKDARDGGQIYGPWYALSFAPVTRDIVATTRAFDEYIGRGIFAQNAQGELQAKMKCSTPCVDPFLRREIPHTMTLRVEENGNIIGEIAQYWVDRLSSRNYPEIPAKFAKNEGNMRAVLSSLVLCEAGN